MSSKPRCRIVVAAAVRWKGVIYVGVRHFDDIMRAQMDAAGIVDSDITEPMEEGFICNQRQWLTRDEAAVVAKEAGQLGLWRDEPLLDFGLQSENLY